MACLGPGATTNPSTWSALQIIRTIIMYWALCMTAGAKCQPSSRIPFKCRVRPSSATLWTLFSSCGEAASCCNLLSQRCITHTWAIWCLLLPGWRYYIKRGSTALEQLIASGFAGQAWLITQKQAASSTNMACDSSNDS